MNDATTDHDKDLSRLDLTSAEIAVLKKACKRYRTTLPVYLESSREEIEIIDRLLLRLP